MATRATTATTSTTTTDAAGARRTSKGLGRASFIVLIVLLAWAPFPLGSNRPWAWSLLCLLIAASALLWVASVWFEPQKIAGAFRGIAVPGVLGLAALGWGIIQVLSVVPASWAHPVWQLAAEALGEKTAGVISLNPWRTEAEVMKLASYALVFLLARVHAGREERARQLLQWLIGIGSFYAIYAFGLLAYGASQLGVFYDGKTLARDLSGPFVNHNSFATYAGLLALCALARLFDEGQSGIHLRHSWRRFLFLTLQYLASRGVPYVIGTVVLISAVIGTASRAGNFSLLWGMIALLALAGPFVLRQSKFRLISGAFAAAAVVLVVLFAVNGDILAGRLNDMTTLGVRDDTRLMLWNAATRMINDAPLLGLGLGTFENAYPMYSDTMMALVMDRGHNDYLELAAGWGVPAAVLWCLAIGYLALLCFRGVRTRHRNRIFPMLGVAATVLVAAHSMFDFSLQMPAIAVTYAAIIGIGVAQSFSTRQAHRPSKTFNPTAAWFWRAAILVPPLLIGGIAGPRMISGLAQDAALPITSRIAINRPLPTKSYQTAAAILAKSSRSDGESQIQRAIATENAGEAPSRIVPLVENGLRHAPFSARGWLLLAQEARRENQQKAVTAFNLAMMLAPREYYLVGPRLISGAPLWDGLGDSARKQLLDDVRMVIAKREFAPALWALLAEPGGSDLITRSFEGRPDQLRAFNRAVARKRLGL